jgi:hypothetical protein
MKSGLFLDLHRSIPLLARTPPARTAVGVGGPLEVLSTPDGLIVCPALREPQDSARRV